MLARVFAVNTSSCACAKVVCFPIICCAAMSVAAEAAIKEALLTCGRSRPDSNFYDDIAKVRVCSLVGVCEWPWAGLSMFCVHAGARAQPVYGAR